MCSTLLRCLYLVIIRLISGTSESSPACSENGNPIGDKTTTVAPTIKTAQREKYLKQMKLL